jgi:hypothetical protein
MRYRVRLIADANCDSLQDEVLGEFNSLQGAEHCAENCEYCYGAGIEDTETGLIDFGKGFGVKMAHTDATDTLTA